ncbi:MAG TPA: carboxymuconolactone decarboxylase family protein [Acidimicrobiales bacterium]|jgi:alkylhydroperoxidase family enzyme|nr:carboxymuconolactone decarboxylase family protein [Acidimicrobiales bacterium]
MNQPSAPRLAPLGPDDLTGEQRELLGPGPSLNIFATLVRNPGLYRKWLPFGGKLLAGSKLTARERELIILRTAYRCGSAYEWGQHVAIGREAGLSDDEIRRVADGAGAPGWDPADAAVLQMVDDLQDHHCMSDATWSALAATHDERQLVELPLLSGHYAMLAGALNSFGVPTEGPLPGLGEA